jgi:hypothetical protein
LADSTNETEGSVPFARSESKPDRGVEQIVVSTVLPLVKQYLSDPAGLSVAYRR